MYRTGETSDHLERIFNARSIAVVGASRDRRKFGFMTLNSLIKGGFKGAIHPVNPKENEILGLKSYPSLSAIPGSVDVVSIVIPAELVPGVIREAGAKGAVGAVVHSGGFSESGRHDQEIELMRAARESNVRIMGPNIQGISYLPNKMCVMFFPVITARGPLAVITQSGTVTAALTEWAEDEGLGISAAINLGNQSDLCEADYLDFFANDGSTKVVLMYLEGVKNGPRFLASLKGATTRKPVVILKAGRTECGRRSAASHTGSLAANHKVFISACRQCGATVVHNLEDSFDAAKGLACIRPPKGNRLLSVSTSGGAGTLAGDQAEDSGLVTPLPSPALVEELKRIDASPMAILSNPLDMVSMMAEPFSRVIPAVDRHELYDVILLNLGDPVEGAVDLAVTLDNKINACLAVDFFGGAG